MNTLLKIENLRSLSYFFSPSNFKLIISEGKNKNMDWRINKHLNKKFNNYHSLLKELYKDMTKYYCNEYIFKNEILSKKLLSNYADTKKAVILDELAIGNSIADFVLLNGKVKIFEIKTELDTFSKLNKQIDDYKKFANEIYIVIPDKHKDKIIKEYSNSNVGIITMTKRNALEKIKKSEKNISFEHETIFKILRQNEYLNIIKEEFGIILDCPNTRLFETALNLIKKMDVVKFQKQALKELKKRKSGKYDIYNKKQIPRELNYIFYTLNGSNFELEKINKYLYSKIYI